MRFLILQILYYYLLMFQNNEKEILKKGFIADDNPIPRKLLVNGTDTSLEIEFNGCWNIIDKNQLNVCYLLIHS